MADEDVNWNEDDLVIRAQGETVVYRNQTNATVIRQRDPFSGDDEMVIIIQPEFLPALINKLQQHHAENRRCEVPD